MRKFDSFALLVGLCTIGVSTVLYLMYLAWGTQAVPEPAHIDSPRMDKVLPIHQDVQQSKDILEKANRVQHLERLQSAKTWAAAATEEAENHVLELETQLDLIEAQIQDIESRGDDPAEHAEEVMPYFRPVFQEFMDAQLALENAIEIEGQADAALASAVGELSDP